MSYHPSKFVGHRHPGSRDIMAFVCRVALQEHVTRPSSDFMIRSFSR